MARFYALGSLLVATSLLLSALWFGTATAEDPSYETSAISSGFNGTDIDAGNWIWFSANFKYSGAAPQTIAVENARIQFSAGGVDYDLAVPDARVDFINDFPAPSSTYNGGSNTFLTDVPSGEGSDIFLTGLAWQVPVNLSGGISPVVFTADIGATDVPALIKWKWGAAVYTSFSSDYNALGIQIVHTTPHAGTPHNFTDFVIGGARGGGGSNFTGSWSGTASVNFDVPVSIDASTWGGVKGLYR